MMNKDVYIYIYIYLYIYIYSVKNGSTGAERPLVSLGLLTLWGLGSMGAEGPLDHLGLHRIAGICRAEVTSLVTGNFSCVNHCILCTIYIIIIIIIIIMFCILLLTGRALQVRVLNDSCIVADDFRNAIHSCYDAYYSGVEDKKPFGVKNGTA